MLAPLPRARAFLSHYVQAHLLLPVTLIATVTQRTGFTMAMTQARQQRRVFREELAQALREAIANGDAVDHVRKQYGVSGYTIQRGLNALKRWAGDPSMSNRQLYRLLRA